MKRILNEQEKKLVRSQLERLVDELEYQEAMLKHAVLMLECVLEQNFKKQKREYLDKKVMLAGDIKNIQDAIGILNDQLKNGVEVKKDGDNDRKTVKS